MRQLELSGREVQLWVVRLEAAEDNYALACSWLSADETERAGRFRFEKHRRAFVLGRGALRGLAASYLGMTPASVCFSYGPKGKPSLADLDNRLKFNVSNSGDLAAYAFTLGCEIGVDVEHRHRMLEIEGIARRFFAAAEVEELMSLPESHQHDGFFNCWTRKEAYIKAIGEGLSVPLHSFQVTLRPGVAARMVMLDGSAAAAECWKFHSFTPASDYSGAIAYRDRERPLIEHPLLTADELLEPWRGVNLTAVGSPTRKD
jgi:4'-phosphopantetheinyl transferase